MGSIGMTFFAPPGNKDAIAIYISFIFVLSLFLLTLFWDYVKDIIIGLFESNTPSITKDKLIMKKKLPAINQKNTLGIPTFNLSGLNLLDLTKELQNSLNSSSSSFIFMRERANKKLKLQKDKIGLILQTIEELSLTQRELVNFQADAFLSNKLLEQIIAGKQEEIRNIAEIKKKEFLLKHKVLDDEIVKIDHSKEARETALEAAKLANLKTKTEIMILTANSKESKAKAELIMYVLKELDLKNMPQTLQTYLITSIVNPQGSQYQDFDMQERLKKYIEKEADAKSRHSLAVASQAEHQTRIAEKTADKSVYELDTVRDSTKRK
jgi:hypothetical protein